MLLLLEGVDATTSSTVQARQSYTVDDICWDATFVPCARRQRNGGIHVDFDKLHAVRPLGMVLPRSRWMRMPTVDLPLASLTLAASRDGSFLFESTSANSVDERASAGEHASAVSSVRATLNSTSTTLGSIEPLVAEANVSTSAAPMAVQSDMAAAAASAAQMLRAPVN